jgi:hypothetical protein
MIEERLIKNVGKQKLLSNTAIDSVNRIKTSGFFGYMRVPERSSRTITGESH